MATPPGIANQNIAETPLYDPVGGQNNVAWQAGTVTQDTNTGEKYAPGAVQVSNANANGQATKVNSSPVVLASDEVVPVQSSRLEIIGQAPGIINAINTDLIPATDVT